MKTLLLLLICAPIFCLAQNGGQYAENDFGKLEYLGYQNGNYTVKITNKQTCAVSIKTTWLSKDTTFGVNGSTTITVQLPGSGSITIKSKPLTRCAGYGDMGWLEISTPASLPITFKSIRTEKLGPNKVKVIFDVADVSGVNTYNIQLSTDGINYKNIAVVFPDDTQPNKTYTIIVNL